MLKYDKQRRRLINIAVDNRSSPFYALRDRQGNAIGVTACDIDGDGREEIYVLNTNNAFAGTVHAGQTLVCTLTHTRTHSHTHTQRGYTSFLAQRQWVCIQIFSLSHLHQITDRLCAAINQSERYRAHTAKTARPHLYHFYRKLQYHISHFQLQQPTPLFPVTHSYCVA